MSLSLKDQLLKAGLIKADEPKSKSSSGSREHAKKMPEPPAKQAKSISNREPSLAELYQARSAQEAADKKKLADEQAAKTKAKAERKQKTLALIQGAALNIAVDAENALARHFEYGRKIRRIYVSTEQRMQLNAGELGVVQMDGKFLLLPGAVVAAVHAIAPEFVALMGKSEEPAQEGDYADPQYQIPDDLVW